MERGNIPNNAMFLTTQTITTRPSRGQYGGMGRGQVSTLDARGHWNGNKCWDQDIENIGEEEERWGTNCDPLEIDDGCSDGGDGNGRGNEANGGAVLC